MGEWVKVEMEMETTMEMEDVVVGTSKKGTEKCNRGLEGVVKSTNLLPIVGIDVCIPCWERLVLTTMARVSTDSSAKRSA